MTQVLINVGSNPNDASGDNLRNAFIKTNSNFTDLYTQIGAITLPSQTGNSGKYLTTNGTSLGFASPFTSPSFTTPNIDTATAVAIVSSGNTFNLVNTAPTTVINFGGNAPTINVGISGGKLVISSFIIYSNNTSVAAAGNNSQSTATLLTKDVNILTSVTAGSATGVTLPAGTAGMVIFVYNATSTTANIYPVYGGSAAINALGTNAAYTLAGTTGTRFVCASATQWYAF